MMKNVQLPLLVVIGMAVAGSLCAQEFAGLLRDELALGLTPTTSNWGMGGAYVGVPGKNSMNPAALAFVTESSLTLGGNYWNPGHGADVYAGRFDVVFPFILGSHTRLMGYYYETNGSGTIKAGLDTEFKSTTFGLQVGIPITDTLAIGLGGYPYEKAEIDLQTPGGTIEGQAESQLGSVQLGVQWRATETVTVGAEYIYIIDELQADIPGVGHLADDFYITYGTFGISWVPCDRTLLAVDYRIGEIEGESAAGENFDVDIDRWAFGAERGITDRLTIRVGSNNGGLTLGAGYQFCSRATLDYAYLDKAYRDREDVFGTVKLHSVALTVTF